jgi:3-oxoacyl-[acyl-carrier protein] reductase
MKNKKILITGSTGGMGSAIAKRLAGEDSVLFLHYYGPDNEKEVLKKELKKINKNIHFFKADLTKKEDIDKMMDKISKLGSVDILINSVSLPIVHKELAEKDWPDFQSHIELQVRSLLNILKRTIPGMKERKYGKIINILTEAVVGRPPTNMSDYITAKHALLGFSKCLAVEYGKYNITCNCVSPGFTDTDLTSKFPGKLKDIVASQTPLKRICRPEDVAGLIRFLCSNEADFINGENIVINGGYTIR